jgi:hypothetical protein
MRLRDWKPDNWEGLKKSFKKVYREVDTDYHYPLTRVDIEQVRESILSELEKKVIRFQHSCNPCLTGLEVKDPTLVIEPPMYLIDLGDPLK